MNPKIRKGTLIVIIILLLIFVLLTIAGFYFHFAGTPEDATNDNPNHEFHYNNELWFYDDDDNLIGTYECTTSNCNYATSYINDGEYSIDFYAPSDEEDGYLMDYMINNRFVFLADFESTSYEAFLYDIKNGISYKNITYTSVKDYGVGIANNLFIVENSNHKYGVLQIGETAQLVVPFEYDFIGLINALDENGQVLGDYFVVSQSGSWFILGSGGAVVSTFSTEEIVTYNGTYIVTKDTANYYHLVNYQNERVLTDDFADLSFTDRYLNCLTTSNEFYVYDLVSNMPISSSFALLPTDTYRSVISETGDLEVYINDQLEETIDL